MATKVKLIADGVITPDQITLTTASTGTNTTAPATTAFVQQEISALVDSSPEALNTLNELAAALGDDANFSTTVTNSIALKAPLASPTFTGTLTASGLAYPTSDGTNGQVLTTDGSGTLSFADAAGGIDGIVSSANATAITIDSSENVGIGDVPSSNATGSMSPRLFVDNNLGDGTLGLQIASYHPSIVLSDKSSGLHNYIISHDGGHFSIGYEGGTAGSSNSFTSRLKILSSGNVGIGTDNPDAKLEVAGASGSSSTFKLSGRP